MEKLRIEQLDKEKKEKEKIEKLRLEQLDKEKKEKEIIEKEKITKENI